MENSTATILIVDDNPLNLKLAADVLGFDGYLILTAADAQEAQSSILRTPPDLIVMDIGLPDLDGLSLTRILKADRATSHILIVALSAFAMKSDQERAVQAGCDGYITKPIDTRKFANQVSALLSLKKERVKFA